MEDAKNDPFAYSNAMQDFIHALKSPELAPEVYVTMEKFAVDKSSQTYGNAAFDAYKNSKTNLPFL